LHAVNASGRVPESCYNPRRNTAYLRATEAE
jgi:hypothetical protein